MGIYFDGGERIQRGKGIGGILKFAKKLLFPIVTAVQKVTKSDTGKKIVNAVKEQAINSSVNIANDLVEGKNFKKTLNDEFNNVKKKSKRKAVEIGAEYVNDNILNIKKKKIIKKRKRKKKLNK